MAFVIDHGKNSDVVTFFVRSDFSPVPGPKNQIIDRGDMEILRYYIIKHMVPDVKYKRSDTPLV